MKILIVIPARGGSKRIPRKNVRMMNGKPLILYSIDNALRVAESYEADICVSTDDEELGGIAESRNIEIIWRDQSLAADNITLDPVIYDSVKKMENRFGVNYDVVITMQATSPTLRAQTLMGAIEAFIDSDYDTMISCVNKPHLSWRLDNGRIVKNYEKRLNSQELPQNYLETGAFLITRRGWVSEDSRIGENITVYETDQREAIDIDSEEDWISAESILRRKRILLRCVGLRELGMGHIYRCLSFANKLIGHDILFVTEKGSNGVHKLEESFFPYEEIEDDADYEKILKNYMPDVVVNDVLDTEESLIKLERKYTKRIVCKVTLFY